MSIVPSELSVTRPHSGRLGLFDNPFVNVEDAGQLVGNDRFMERGREAQAKSMVLLKNNGILPLSREIKVYAEGMISTDMIDQFGTLVSKPAEADVIILRITTPYGDPKGNSMLERFFRMGRLNYSAEELEDIMSLMEQKPTVVIANLDRPAILTEIDARCQALMADFGTSDEVLTEVLFGARRPEGKLPFELPSSVEAVENQLEDMPYDSEDPLYEFGFGLLYN
jgi:beta-glucosidase